MCSDTKSIFESIEDYVINQDKIVTYKWLSKTLNIHVNEAKQLLYSFSNNCTDNLLVTYLVSGKSQDEGLKVYIVNQNELERTVSKLNAVTSKHVYSVQKQNSTLSSSDLYLADSTAQLEESQKNLSSISRRKVEKREFKVVIPDKKPSASISTSKQQTTSISKPTLPSTTSKQPQKVSVTASKSPTKAKVLSPIKQNVKRLNGSIGALFTKQYAKNAEKKNNPSVDAQKEKIEKEEINEKEKINNKEKESIEEDMEVDVQEEKEEKDSPKVSPEPKKVASKSNVISKNKSNKTSNKNLKRKQSPEIDKTPAKKRKRIVSALDSESESNDESDDENAEEEPIPDEPLEGNSHEVPDSDEEVIPPTPYGQRAKKRVRKLVDITYTDEDGFITTKKDYVYESQSDDDNVEENQTKNNDSKEEINNKQKVIEKDVKESNTDKVKVDNEKNNTSDKRQTKLSPEKNEKKSAGRPKKNDPKTNNKQKSITNFFKKM